MKAGGYREKYVAFLDLLGFSRLVRDTAHQADRRQEIIEALRRLKDTACDNPRTGLIVTHFSDCLVLSSDRTEPGLFDMVRSLSFIAENLLQISAGRATRAFALRIQLPISD